MRLIDPRLMFTPVHDIASELDDTDCKYENVKISTAEVKLRIQTLASIINERVLTLLDEDDDDLSELADDLRQALDNLEGEHAILEEDLNDLDIDATLRTHFERLLETTM